MDRIVSEPASPSAPDTYVVPSVADLVARSDAYSAASRPAAYASAPASVDARTSAYSVADAYTPAPTFQDTHTLYPVPAASQRSAGSFATGFASASTAAPASSASAFSVSSASARPMAGTVRSAIQPSAAPAPIALSLASSDGNASTQTASFGITPSAGTTQFLLTTINPAGSVPTGYGSTPADTNVTNLNTYFGLAAGTLAGRGAADGSGYLSQQVTLAAGNIVSFDYVFLTDEDNTLSGSQYHNDQAFFTVNGAINTTLYQASQFSNAQLNNGSNTIFSFQTPGYVTVNYTVPTSGNYTFGFGVIDLTANTIKSGLLIDNFYYTPVPEPSSWAGGTLLLGAAVLTLRRQRKFAGRALPASATASLTSGGPVRPGGFPGSRGVAGS